MIKKSTAFCIPAFLLMLGGTINILGNDFGTGSFLLFLSGISYILVHNYEHIERYHPEPVRFLMRRK